MTNNPYYYGNPVPEYYFIGRRRELRRLVGRICNYGQSSALVGDPRVGKSSVLKFIQSRQGDKNLFNQFSGTLLFSYLDVQTFDSDFAAHQFWRDAFYPLKMSPDHSSLSEAYRVAQISNFDKFSIEKLFSQILSVNARVVLLIDEFDLLLHHRTLNNPEFYGGLRSLVSRSEGALAMIISARQSLATLNQSTQDLSRTGSPFFNFMDEVLLEPFSIYDTESLLKLAGRRFKPRERTWLALMSGGHPYLLQVAASALWEAYEDGERDANAREKQVVNVLYREATKTISNTWNLWPPAVKLAFVTVALNEIPNMLDTRSFDLISMTKRLPDYTPELRQLEQRGYISPDPVLPGGWQIHTKIFLLWLADELRRAVRDDMAFDKWFSAQEWQGFFTKGEKETFKRALINLRPVFKEGYLLLKSFLPAGK